MSQINIKSDAIDSAVKDLRSLKQSCDSANTNPPGTVGGGKTVNELEEIGKLYQTMYTHFSQMISSTISLLEKTKTGFAESDRKAADEIRE